MGTKYLSDSEVLKVAMNMEDEGYKFYDKVAKGSKKKDAKKAFEKLRDEEVEHYRTFKDMLDKLPDASARDYFGISEEVASFLKVLVDTGVFKDVDQAAIAKLSEIQALELGIKAERDSVLFYTEAQRSSANPKAKEIMSGIIEEERKHVVTLTDRLRVARKLF